MKRWKKLQEYQDYLAKKRKGRGQIDTIGNETQVKILNYLNKEKTKEMEQTKWKDRKHKINRCTVVLFSLQCCQASYLVLFPIVRFNLYCPSVNILCIFLNNF